MPYAISQPYEPTKPRKAAPSQVTTCRNLGCSADTVAVDPA